MRITIFLLFLVAFKFASSQTLTADFPDSNYFYNESRSERGSDMTPYNTINYTIYFKKDTIVNSIKYHLLNIKYTIEYFNPNTPRINADHEYALLRNDKQNKKVYLKGLRNLSFNLTIDTTETLFYDFDLKVGDEYKARPEIFYTSDSLFVNKIDTIIDPDNIKRAVYTISTRYNTDEMMKGKIIQGIGGYNGLTGYISFVWNNSYGEQFNCFSFNGKSYEANFGLNPVIINNSWPCEKHKFVSVEYNKVNEINAFPNPTTDRIIFNTNEDIKNIRIYNSRGVLQLNLYTNDKTIKVNQLESGIYIAQIITINKVFTSKFVKY